jgi:hypothetical protein
MQADQATAVCRHEGCGKRFALSHYGNRTSTSSKTRKGRHLFCSARHRKAHSRRLAAIGGGVTALGGTITAGVKTTDFVELFSPQKTTEQPRSAPREWLRVHFHDEAPTIGCGLRLIAVDRITPKWVRIRDHAGRTAKLSPTIYASLKPAAFGRSAAMGQYEARFPNAAASDQLPN